jgi:putative ABC transport system substrate-binding protein
MGCGKKDDPRAPELLAVTAQAQQARKIPQIGFLGATSFDAVKARVEAFQQGLREFGYVEGKSILVEYRWADGKFERLPDLAAELVRLKVDIIVTSGPIQTPFVKKATSSIPIVMAFDNDPVGNGFVESLARPGGNITGLSTLAPEIRQKRLEHLKEVVPRLSRVAVLGKSREPGNAQMLEKTKETATKLKVSLLYLDILDPKHIEPAFLTAIKERAQAVLTLTNPIVTERRKKVIDLAAKHRLPAIYDRAEFVHDGGLMSYGVSSTDLFRRAAWYVDKILKGANPAELPVEQPTKFELVINLKAAKQIGITIPQSVLFRAAKVIK